MNLNTHGSDDSVAGIKYRPVFSDMLYLASPETRFGLELTIRGCQARTNTRCQVIFHDDQVISEHESPNLRGSAIGSL